MDNDKRLHQAKLWLRRVLKQDFILSPLANDASFRRYFRVSCSESTYILMDSPPEKEAVIPFITLAKIFRDHQVCTPEIHAHNIDDGFLLLTDFGNKLLSQHAREKVDHFYAKALKIILQIQAIKFTDQIHLPIFDDYFANRELGIFYEWFLQNYLKLELSPLEEQMIQDSWTRLISHIQAQPQVCMHRDFHAGNLMILTDGELGVVDFQGAMRGPCTYDAVSLLKDCRIQWPKSLVDNLLKLYHQESPYHHISLQQFRSWFDLTGLQMHLKNIGNFARLYLRDHKPQYLQYLPGMLQYVKDATEKYSFLDDFHQFLVYIVQPQFETIRQ